MDLERSPSDSRCPSCGGATVREVSEGVEGDRLVWSEEISCRDCPRLILACGDGDLPSSLRTELLTRYGAFTVRLDPAEAGPLRVRLLSLLRASGGRSIAAAIAEYDRLTGEGVTGTVSEMRLLADRLTAVGVRVHLDPPTLRSTSHDDIGPAEDPADVHQVRPPPSATGPAVDPPAAAG